MDTTEITNEDTTEYERESLSRIEITSEVECGIRAGVAVIIGQRTGKILFLGVRNKYCCICVKAKAQSAEPKDHKCYKNWDSSSTSMEADIIVDGFVNSVEMYNIKYTTLVGDGDSSVTKKLAEVKPYGPRTVQKVECRNHLLRNMCNKLRELATKARSSKGTAVPVPQRKRLTDATRRLRYGVQHATKHAIDSDATHSEKIFQLKQDILNAANHIFGQHLRCATYFCNGPKIENEYNWIPHMKESGLYADILGIMSRVASNAESLLLNMTNNAAECYNNVLAKFVGGKRINFASRRSYQTRCAAAAISFNEDPGQLPRLIHKKAVWTSPGFHTKKFIQCRYRHHQWKLTKRRLFPEKFKKTSRPLAQADADYGAVDEELPMPVAPEPLTPAQFDQMKRELMRSMEMTAEELLHLERATVGQSDVVLWQTERSKRLTASNFGPICRMKRTTSCQKTVERLMYSAFKGNKATRWGNDHEIVAREQLEEDRQIRIQSCGLCVDPRRPYLAASPDGLIDDDGIVEIKCPYESRMFTPMEAVEKKKIKFAQIKDGDIVLKISDKYFYQIQGQLHVTNRSYCLFVIWTPKGMNVEKILKDDNFWITKMALQLESFFFGCLLPELVEPQHPYKKPIKDLRHDQ